MILYLTEPGAFLTRRDNTVIVKKSDDNLLKQVPIEKLEAVVLMGNCHITTPLVSELLEREIPVTWLSYTGKFFGRLEPTTGYNIERQRSQFRAADDAEFCLALARAIVGAKIKNGRVLLSRYNRERGIPEVQKAIEDAYPLLALAEQAETIAQVMGYEGTFAKIYFQALGQLVPPPFAFHGRTRRPPRDPVNSMLSFGYTLMLYEIYTAVLNRGLHPYMGLMHQAKRGHPALCSDLLEEWRSTLVDAMVLGMLTHGEVKPEDFQTPDPEAGGVYMVREAGKNFVAKFENRLRLHNSYLTYVDYPLTFRESVQFQVGAMAKAIEQRDPSIYRPILIR